jgi:UBX domain-containing protein 6
MDSVGAKVKKFFAKKKSDAKFSKAGPGRKLADEGGSSNSKPKEKDVYAVPAAVRRDDLTDEMKMARDAALNRLNKNTTPSFDLSLKAIKEKARKELQEEESNKKRSIESDVQNLKLNEEPKQDEGGEISIIFGCSLISDELLPKKEWKQKIKDFLYEQLALNNSDQLDPGITACLIIKSCNTIERAEDCIDTLKKYLSNILQNPTETKFHKIRMSNRIFCDKVANVEGSSEFLKYAGFSEELIDGENFLVWSPDDSSIENLLRLVDALNECESIKLELDRNMQVLLPSQNKTISMSQDFFKISADELKREQMTKTSAIEEAQVMKTRAMREKEQEKYIKKFKFSVVRIFFPDGLILQVNDKSASQLIGSHLILSFRLGNIFGL